MRLALGDVEVDGRRVDVVVDAGLVESVTPVGGRRPGGDEVVDGAGGVLIPGLWDHHVHLLATAAARASVAVGPPEVTDATSFDDALRGADLTLPAGAWLRAVGYHESVAGELDRHRLDAVLAGRPVRVQHRSGAAWVLNSRACRLVDLEHADIPGVERDASGSITGRAFGADDWLRARISPDAPVLDHVGADADRFGIVGFTDTTPSADTGGWDRLAAARRDGALRQRVVVTGGPELVDTAPPAGLELGPVKLYLADHALPALDDLVHAVRAAHHAGRGVAFHAVTRSALVLAIAAVRDAGAVGGVRIEHGSVIPPELDADLLALGATVVTQPSFLTDRGDSYLADVEPDDRPHLYRCATLLDAGIPVAASSDGPHATLDPWAGMRAAVERRTASGQAIGTDEAVVPRRALDLYLGPHRSPGGPPRRVVPGAPADLCLLDEPLDAVVTDLGAHHVRATVVAGAPVWLS